MRPYAGVVLVIAALLGCNLFKGSSGSPDAGESDAGRAATSREPPVVGAPKSGRVLDLAVGQWTQHVVIESDGRRSTLSYKVVSKEGAAYWIEVVSGPANAGTVIQVLLELGERHDAEAAQIHAARVRMPNGIVKDMRGKMLEPTKPGYKKALRQIFVSDLSGLTQEDAAVPAGRFRGCYRHEQTTSFAGIDVTSTLWRHTAVPITALVKSVATDGGTSIELTGYGLSGAKSDM